MSLLTRRRLMGAACAHCSGLWAFGARAQVPGDEAWPMPGRFAAPDLASDEGGLWALMQREEARLRRGPFMIQDAALRDYLRGIVARLAGEHAADIRVYPVRNPFFNASMAPNGMMQVWSGLLLRVENEAQLAAILGHEIGHYVQRHLLERLRDAKGRSAFGLWLSLFGVVGLVGQLAMIAGALGFSRDHEREADRIGLRLMRRAGYDPREASKVWDHLRAETKAGPDGGESSNPMMATHPPSDERSQTLARLAEDATGGFVGQVEYDQRIAPLKVAMLEDELRRARYAETLVLLDRLIVRLPQRTDLLYFRGETRRLREAEGDLDAALADFQAAVARGDEPPQTHRSLGYLQQKRQDAAAARAAFERYLQLAPQAPDAAMVKTYLNETG